MLILSVQTIDVAHVRGSRRFVVDDMGYRDDGICQITARFGFQDYIDVPAVLLVRWSRWISTWTTRRRAHRALSGPPYRPRHIAQMPSMQVGREYASAMRRKVVLFELNEVPWRIVDDHVARHPGSALAKALERSHQYEAVAADRGHLSPWVTWPSLHRGVNDERHMIGDLGQDRAKADQLYPPIWRVLRDEVAGVGVCGSLHSFPPPDDMTSYSFYLPDTFATSHEAHPAPLSTFQGLNLAMARDSARNVDRSIPPRAAARLMARSRELGIRSSTYRAILGQLASERRNSCRSTRRRTFQAVLGFDVYSHQLERTRPAFSTFFSNHVASAMHRYWAATYPGDYDELGLPAAWIDRYREEVPWAMCRAEQMIAWLVAFADRNPEYQIWIAASMGQGPTLARGLETAVYLKDLRTFMTRLGLPEDGWEQRPAMLPQTNVMVAEGLSERFESQLRGLRMVDQPIHFRQSATGFFSMDFGHPNMHKRPTPLRYEGRRHALADFGLEAVEIEDRSDTTAYHVPEGVLIVYDPSATTSGERERVSALSVAPALLRTFGLRPLDHMESGDELQAVLG